MALGWLSALKVIPWSDVVGAAPTVVRGAQQLWQKVRSEPAEAARPTAPPPAPAPGIDPREAAHAALAAHVDALEARTAALAREAHAASELIATLAEQNARLVDVVGQLRLRLRLLFAAAAVLTLAVAVLGVLAFAGR